MKPSRLRYFLAHAAFRSTWCGAVVLAFFAARSLPVSPTLLRNPKFAFWFLCVILVGFALGWILTLCLVAPFIFALISKFNGAPYVVGDSVYILVGRNRERVVRVYEVRHDDRQMRVELGDEAREGLQDVFDYNQVCRERKV